MTGKALIITVLFALLITGICPAGETTVLTGEKISRLEPELEVSLNRILDDGSLLFVCEGKGKNVKLLLVDSITGKELKSLFVPTKEITYIASDSNGNNVIIYSNGDKTFYLARPRVGDVVILFRRSKGKPGFALYTHRKSRISFVNGKAMAWGYFYDDKGNFENEWIVKVDPEKKGMAAFEKVMKMDKLRKMAKSYLSSATAMGNIEVNGDFLVFSPRKGEEGTIVVYNFKTGEHYPAAKFSSIAGLDLAEKKPLLAAVIKDNSTAGKDSSLLILNLEKKNRAGVVSGRLANPVFNPENDKIAVGSAALDKNKKLSMQIMIVDVSRSDYPCKILRIGKGGYYVDWKFVDKDRALILFDGKNIYRHNLR